MIAGISFMAAVIITRVIVAYLLIGVIIGKDKRFFQVPDAYRIPE